MRWPSISRKSERQKNKLSKKTANAVHFTHLLRPHSEGARPCFLSQLHSPLPEGKNRVSGSSHITSKHLERVSCFPQGITEQGIPGKGRSFLRAELVLLLLMWGRWGGCLYLGWLPRCIGGIKAGFVFCPVSFAGVVAKQSVNTNFFF